MDVVARYADRVLVWNAGRSWPKDTPMMSSRTDVFCKVLSELA